MVKMMWRQYGSDVSDEALLGRLDTCLSLTPNERQGVTAAMARFTEKGKLPRRLRDWCFAVAKAKQLFRRTEAKPAPNKPLGTDGGDNFSTRRTAGTAFAERILQNRPVRPPMKRSA